VKATHDGEEREALMYADPKGAKTKRKPKAEPANGDSSKGRGRRSSFFNRPKLIKAEKPPPPKSVSGKK
jgi:hypothetical protein